jgi:hypothetical protein
MSTLQVDNINPYLSSSIILGSNFVAPSADFNDYYPANDVAYLSIRQREGSGVVSIGIENDTELTDAPLTLYSYGQSGSLSLDNTNGFVYKIQTAEDPSVFHQISFGPDGAFDVDTLKAGIANGEIFSVEARSGIAQTYVPVVTITDQTGSFDARNGNFFETTLTADVDNRFIFSNLDGGQTINILVTTAGTATVSFEGGLVKQPDGFSYTPTTGPAKDILTFISFDDETTYLVAVKNLV